MTAAIMKSGICFTDLTRRRAIPQWTEEIYGKALWLAPERLLESKPLPGLTVIRAQDFSAFEAHFHKVSPFFEELRAESPWSGVVLEFLSERPAEPQRLADLLGKVFTGDWLPEMAFGEAQLEASLCEAFAKALLRERKIRESRASNDPVAGARKVIAATADLRTESGRLSAAKIAERFGIPLSHLAKALGRTKQAVSQTPDSPALQKDLWQFERVARLGAIFNAQEFAAWLNQPNKHIVGNGAPIELLLDGRAEAVGDFSEGILTGSPM
jgi:hypothetical protein